MAAASVGALRSRCCADFVLCFGSAQMSINGTDDCLERRSDDIGIDPCSKQGRTIPHTKLDIAGRLRFSARADCVLVIIHQFDIATERVNEGVYRAVAGSVDALRLPRMRYLRRHRHCTDL